MRRFIAPFWALGFLVALAVTGWHAAAVAQDASPPADEVAPEGPTFERLGFGVAEELPPDPADLELARVGLDPGAGFPVESDSPSVALVSVEAGAFTFRLETPIRVTRAATLTAFATVEAGGEATVPEPELVPAGTEFTLAAGESAVFPLNTAGEARNDGAERAVILVAFVAPPGEED